LHDAAWNTARNRATPTLPQPRAVHGRETPDGALRAHEYEPILHEQGVVRPLARPTKVAGAVLDAHEMVAEGEDATVGEAKTDTSEVTELVLPDIQEARDPKDVGLHGLP